MDLPIVSIITRTKDRELFLSRAVESVLSQVNPPPWEWIIVNDGGATEAVESVLRAAVIQFPDQIQILHLADSKGMEHASNQGISQSKGTFIVIHDDDDTWEPAFLERMSDWLRKPDHAGFAGVVCQSIRVEESIENDTLSIQTESPFNPWLETLDPWRVLEENPYPPISFLFRRSAYDKTGPFDEGLPVLGDWEFNIRLILQWPIGVIPEPMARYHHRPPTETGANANTITAGHRNHRHWEVVLRERWRQASPVAGLPEFGKLASIAGNIKDVRRRMDQLLSLPIRPGPQV